MDAAGGTMPLDLVQNLRIVRSVTPHPFSFARLTVNRSVPAARP
jgi:hypothetical protein